MLKLWDAASGQETLSIAAHTRNGLGLAVSPDGRRLATSGAEGGIRIWDAGARPARLREPVDRGYSIRRAEACGPWFEGSGLGRDHHLARSTERAPRQDIVDFQGRCGSAAASAVSKLVELSKGLDPGLSAHALSALRKIDPAAAEKVEQSIAAAFSARSEKVKAGD